MKTSSLQQKFMNAPADVKAKLKTGKTLQCLMVTIEKSGCPKLKNLHSNFGQGFQKRVFIFYTFNT
jgi:hypothetical protein